MRTSMSDRSTSTRRRRSTRRRFLTAAAIFQLAMAQPEGAPSARAEEWKEARPGTEKKLAVSEILEKMRRNGTAIVAGGQPELLSAYRVVTSGAA